MRTAIVHDFLAQAGGAERVVEQFMQVFPNAPIYTSVFDPNSTLPCFANKDVRTSFLQKWLIARRALHKLALPYYPAAFEEFDLSAYDLVLSSSSSFAKGVITGPQTCHVCYCHTPARFAWRYHEYVGRSLSGKLLTPFLRRVMRELRAWDVEVSQRVDYFIVNSENIANRVRKYYRREPDAVIYPPVDTRKYEPVCPSQVGDYFLVVSRMVGYKRVDLAIEACNRLQVPLHIVGGGPEWSALHRIAGPTIRFLGYLSDAETANEYAHCRAMILPGEEDFGITPLEAMASGRPVIAFGAGGALETVVDGQTGLFFREQHIDSLCAALKSLDPFSFEPALLRAHAMRFDTAVFIEKIREFTEGAVQDYRSRYVHDPQSTLDRSWSTQRLERLAGNQPSGIVGNTVVVE
jgi:glycosyltransferase involved in cell wall biosynthesis